MAQKYLPSSFPSRTTVGLSLLLTMAMLPLRTEAAPILFGANLDSTQVIVNGGSTADATALASFALDPSHTQLSYRIEFSNELFLSSVVPIEIRRNAIISVHIHFGRPGTGGPHVLNVFGSPSEDDSQLVIDFDNNVLSGVWDDSDALGDPNLLGTSKLLSEYIEALFTGNLYVAVHTAGRVLGRANVGPSHDSGGVVTLRGQITPQSISEADFTMPGGLLAGLAWLLLLRLLVRKTAISRPRLVV